MRALVLSLAWTIAAYSQEPDSTERAAVLARMREAADGYGNRLQDFSCIKLITRSAGSPGHNTRWKLLETQEQEVNYVAHREKHRLLKVNGSAHNAAYRVKSGYTIVAGEFAVLDHVFDPKAMTGFEWDHAEEGDGRKLCVFQYRVDQEHSSLSEERGSSRAIFGFRGSIAADCKTGEVMRLSLESDPGSIHTDIHYGPEMIGTRQFLLPQTAVSVSRHAKRVTRSEVKFQNYRKYEATSNIQFGESVK